MEIRELYSAVDREYWIEQIGKSDWAAGRLLQGWIRTGELKRLCGETTQVFLLTDGEELVSFCTLAELDDVRETEIGPWIGFAYTFPRYRGQRRMGILLEHACAVAERNGAQRVYISTNETGLYEKYGFSFDRMMRDMHGEATRVYVKEISGGGNK